MENLGRPAVSRVSFAVNEALDAALEEIEASGAFPGIPLPLRPTLKNAFEEAIYAIAERAHQTGQVPSTFRFDLARGDRRAQAAEKEMKAINRALERAASR